MLPFGLKSRIAFNLAVVMLASLLLLHFVCMITVRQFLIRGKTASAIELSQRLFPLFIENAPLTDRDGAEDQRDDIPPVPLLTSLGVSNALLQRDGIRSRIDVKGADPRILEKLQQLLNDTLSSGIRRTQMVGRGSGLFGLAGRKLLVAMPVPLKQAGSESRAAPSQTAIGLVFPLDDLQAELSSLKQVLLIYVLINALLFGAIGFFRMTRMTVEPIGKLLRRANEFKEETFPYFQAGPRDTEFGQLSLALNRMMQHISSEKSKLKSTVISLEAANRELNKTQEEMVRSEKLVSIGRLSSGIAHEIGNPLGIILGYLELLKQSGLNETERLDFIDRAESELNRISRIIRELLDFSRSGAGMGRQPVSLHHIINEVAEVVGHQPFMAGIRLRLDLSAGNDTILADADRVRQLMLNLVINAADAIVQANPPGGGVMTILTRQEPIPCSLQSGSPAALPGVTATVRDNGCGISAEGIGCIFDPFYTTKAPGKGTGLGLYVCFRTIEELGGSIRAESRPGEGTAMVIHLPVEKAANREAGIAEGETL